MVSYTFTPNNQFLPQEIDECVLTELGVVNQRFGMIILMKLGRDSHHFYESLEDRVEKLRPFSLKTQWKCDVSVNKRRVHRNLWSTVSKYFVELDLMVILKNFLIQV